MSLGLTLKGGKRRELDFYPTPAPVTHALMQFLSNYQGLHIWECAAGDGAMAKVMESYGHIVYTTDIRTGTDFLTTPKGPKTEAIITNPPFNLAAQFIEKAVKEAPLVAMLLKSQYWHAASRYELYKNNTPCYVLPLTWRPDFMHNGKGKPTMEVAWSVWLPERLGHAHYLPLKKPKARLW